MNLDDALHTFLVESRELLEQMEEALLQIENAPNDRDTIAAIFRAAHTIKGSAGLFGLDHIVKFTHVAENVLDKVRSQEITVDSGLVALFLAVHDHLKVLIGHIADDRDIDDEIGRQSDELANRLQAYLGGGRELPEAAPAGVHADAHADVHAKAQVGASTAGRTGGAATGNWHLSLRFDPEVLRNGMDPLAFIRYLGTFGNIVHIVTLTEAVPTLSEIDPEASYLGYEIAFRSDADRETIESAFEFVRDDARIVVLAPHSPLDDYRQLIENQRPGGIPLGEILVRCGTLTPTELALTRHADEGERAQPPEHAPTSLPGARPANAASAPDNQKAAKEHKTAEGALIRINAEKLDAHINLIGELIIASAAISLKAQRQIELLEAASLLSRLVEEIRDSALQLRMVPIGATFNKFQRVVRDVSKELGKDIRLEISGADTELDKTVVEKIGDPLTHLVRNSMDHGIEPVEVRLSRGKPAHGTVSLNAFHDSGNIVIEVADDGGGLDRDKILKKAIDSGLVKPEQTLSDNEVYGLIFEAGLSTAESVNNLSGRGVGMDVVRRNIMALRGTIDIESRTGQGTKMQIRLPLTLAIIDGFLVSVGKSSFVVPLEMVVECVELSADDLSAGQDHLNLRGELLPYIRLTELFEITDAPLPEERTSEASAPRQDSARQPPKRQNVVVVQYAGRRAGLVVDSLQGEFQTVIRPLGQVFNGLEGISGFTILGSGQVALILDVAGLVRQVARTGSRHYGRPVPAAV